MLDFSHTTIGPVIIALGCTVTVKLVSQPVAIAYLNVTVPATRPFTNPLVGLMLAVAGLNDVQVPPAMLAAN